MFGRITPIVKLLPYNFMNYSLLAMCFFISLILIINGEWRRIDRRFIPIMVFNITVIMIQFAKGLSSVSFTFINSVESVAGLIFSTLTIIFFSQQKEFGKSKRFFEIIIVSVGIMLILQVFVSCIESVTNTLLGEYEISRNTLGQGIIISSESRDVLSMIGLSQQSIFGFGIAFTGLIGQHNMFGLMLVFYNIFFLIQYQRSQRKYLLVFCAVVMFALIGNSTRAAIGITLICDYLFFLISSKTRALKYGLCILCLFTLYAGAGYFYNLLSYFYYESDSIASRFELWSQLPLKPDGLSILVFGRSLDDYIMWALRVGNAVEGYTFKGSAESEIFNLYLTYGVISLAMFVYIFCYVYPRKLPVATNTERHTLTLFALAIVVMSLFFTGVIHYASYTLITLTIMGHIHYDLIAQRQSAPSQTE